MKTKVIMVFLGVFLLSISLSSFSNAEDQAKAAEQASVQKSYVCMVNDKYMGKEQIPVEYKGKIYYGCCQGCIGNLQNNRAVRYAIDPATGKEVDKATAYIVMKPNGTGEVLYFESEENYTKYKENHSTQE